MPTNSLKDGLLKDGVLTVLYTGTRRPTITHPQLRIVHRAMLKSAPLNFDYERTAKLSRHAKTLVFYSPNAVHHLAESGILEHLELGQKSVWAVGEKTAESIHNTFDLRAPIHVPEDPQFSGMLSRFAAQKPELPLLAFGIEGSPRTLIGQAPGQFGAAEAAEVHEIPIYQTTARQHSGLAQTIRDEGIRWVALTSPRGVDAFVSHLGPQDLAGLRLAAIGPTTAHAIHQHDLPVDLQVQIPDRDQMMIDILSASLEKRPRRQP